MSIQPLNKAPWPRSPLRDESLPYLSDQIRNVGVTSEGNSALLRTVPVLPMVQPRNDVFQAMCV